VAIAVIPGEEERSPLDDKYQEMLDEQQTSFAPPPIEDNKKKRPSTRPPTGGLEGVPIGRGFGGPSSAGMPRTVSEEERAEWQGYQ
jgi:hypothetical protein